MKQERMSAMPPHCDTLDGPVVAAAQRALEKEDVNLILPYVKDNASADVKLAFEKALRARKADPAAREVADLYFFETAVRLHRAGEGAPYTGLKPAGLDVGPVIPVAEKAIESGSPEALIRLLTDTLRQEVQHRFDHMKHLRDYRASDVAKAREYVEAMLGLQVYSHKLYQAMKAKPHEGGHEHRQQQPMPHLEPASG
jgi:hypothetical protein